MSSSITSILNSANRVTGLSGFDVEGTVAKLMQAEQPAMDRLKQKQQILQWQQDQYRDIIGKLRNFKTQMLDLTSSSNILSAGNLKKYSTLSSNVNVASISGTSTEDMTHTITVTQLATAAGGVSNAPVSIAPNADLTTVHLSDLGVTSSSDETLSINGKSITFNANDTVKSFIDKVNSSGANVKLQYVSGRFVIQDTAGNKTIAIDDSACTDDILSALKLKGCISAATDAQFSFDGMSGLTSSSNSVTVNGLTVNLTGTGTTTISNKLDVDSIYNSIKGFVDQYNSILSAINSKTSEKYDRNYLPLTDAQKSAMKDADITAWQTKAQTGLLANDPLLTSFTNAIRSAMVDPATGKTLGSIGISSSSYTDRGVLKIDESKLRAAIQADPDSVINMFAQAPDPSSVTAKDKYNTEGIGYRLKDIVNTYAGTYSDGVVTLGTLLSKAGMANTTSAADNSLTRSILQYSDMISSEQDRLDRKENEYYTKFSAMEAALEKMNAQSAWLSQQFSSNSQ